MCGRGMQLGISKYSRLHGPWTFYRIPLFYRELQRKKETISDLRDWDPDGIIMGDAGAYMCAQDPKTYTGLIVYDDDVLLKEAGITDFSKYALVTG